MKLKFYLLFSTLVFVFSSLFTFQVQAQNSSTISTCNPTFKLYHPNAPTGTDSLTLKDTNTKVEIYANFPASSHIGCGNEARLFYSWGKTPDNFPITVLGATKRVYLEADELKNFKAGSYSIFLQTSNNNFYSKIYDKLVVLKITANNPKATTGSTNGTSGNSTSMTDPVSNTGNTKDVEKVEGPNTDITITTDKSFDTVLGSFYNPLSFNRPEEVVVRLIDLMLLLVGIISVIMIILGGLRMVASGGSESQIKKGRETVTWAIGGLLVSLMAFSIVALIQSIIS